MLRSVRTPEFAGTVFHEVEARSVPEPRAGHLADAVPVDGQPVPRLLARLRLLSPAPRVLMADGSTRPIAELEVGDAVMGTERVDGRRRHVRTTVHAHWATTRPAVRVRLAGGTEIVAGREHRFLTDRGWRHVTGGWCRAGRRPRLRPGSALPGPGAFAAQAVAPTPGYRRGYRHPAAPTPTSTWTPGPTSTARSS